MWLLVNSNKTDRGRCEVSLMIFRLILFSFQNFFAPNIFMTRGFSNASVGNNETVFQPCVKLVYWQQLFSFLMLTMEAVIPVLEIDFFMSSVETINGS